MRPILGLAVLATTLMASALAQAAPLSWNEADRRCKEAQGAGCCAVADEDGYPKMRGGGPVCSCSHAFGANPTRAQRIKLGKLATAKPVNMSVAPGIQKAK